jgi:hypothetical protein
MFTTSVPSRFRLGLIVVMCAATMTGCGSLSAVTDAEQQEYRSIKYDASVEKPDAKGEICELHRIPTVWAEIRRDAGMCVVPPRQYVHALLQAFPNSYWNVQTCFCERDGFDFAFRYVCPICRALERRWRKEHGWGVDDELPVPQEDHTSMRVEAFVNARSAKFVETCSTPPA